MVRLWRFNHDISENKLSPKSSHQSLLSENLNKWNKINGLHFSQYLKSQRITGQHPQRGTPLMWVNLYVKIAKGLKEAGIN